MRKFSSAVLILCFVLAIAAQSPQKVPAEIALKIREAELRQARAINAFKEAAEAIERARKEHNEAAEEVRKWTAQAFTAAGLKLEEYDLDLQTMEFKQKQVAEKKLVEEKKP